MTHAACSVSFANSASRLHLAGSKPSVSDESVTLSVTPESLIAVQCRKVPMTFLKRQNSSQLQQSPASCRPLLARCGFILSPPARFACSPHSNSTHRHLSGLGGDLK